jgi:hypothetical protein
MDDVQPVPKLEPGLEFLAPGCYVLLATAEDHLERGEHSVCFALSPTQLAVDAN